LAAVKHLILDVNVIVDLWLQENSADETEALFNKAQSGYARLWVSAAALTTLDYVARRAFKIRSLSPQAVAELIPKLVEHLLGHVNVLTNHGFEQLEIYRLATDFEDAQTAAAVRALAGESVCIVTEDESFDALGDVPVKKPAEAVAWLGEQNVPPSNAKPMPFIDLAAQQAAIRPQLERNIETVLRLGQYIMGPEVKQLEEKLAAYVGTKHCITASSGTDTLLIAMMALDVGPGDEVITTPFTFIATGEMIALLGAKPVFVDIDPRTYNIDPAKIEAAITSKTKAIMPVSLYGQCADMDAINAIANKHGLPVIEDAAQSFGATYKGKKSCALSTIGSTSFFPSKPLGGYGDSGALFTNDDALAKAMREIRIHGQDRRYHHPRVGINGRMDTLQAAILLAKLDRFIDWEVQQRQLLGARYTELINSPRPSGITSDLAGVFSQPSRMASSSSEGLGARVVTTPYIEPHNTSVYAQYTIEVDNRDALAKQLNEAGIPTAVHYPIPLHLQPVFANSGLKEGDFPISEAAAKRVMSLPMGGDLDVESQRSIASLLNDLS
jgi:UDP-2-acetamido-2-deoxy-ribo-hexuluronate aminotransferase